MDPTEFVKKRLIGVLLASLVLSACGGGGAEDSNTGAGDPPSAGDSGSGGSESPETPETPDIPETPEAPDSPGTPETPDMPDTPDTPETPETPDTPDAPDAPDAPDNPDGSDDSGGEDYEVPANNFAVNGDVEDNLTNWSTTAGDISRSTSVKHGGSASAYITNRTAAWHGLTFEVGRLTNGNEYEVAVWVKLPEGSGGADLTLTAKRADDSDSSTYNEYTHIDSVAVNGSGWALLTGRYVHSGTEFEHFIIESSDTRISFYADDFSIGGEVLDEGGSESEHRFFVGNITTSGRVRSDFSQYWDQITPENEGKWGSVEGTRDVYNWSGLDAAYNFAKNNNILFKQHTFVWGNQHPNWINSLSAAEQAAEIEEWIRDFCTRYPDVDMIDVVNESTPGHAPAAYAKNALGDDWIIKSFQLARKHCPNATLILNDYNVLTWHTDAFIAMARPAIEAGVVDAIGVQAHGFENWTAANLEANLNKVAALGLPIYVSEYDIARTDDQEQLQIMQSQFPMLYNHPSVKGITLWGYVYGQTWVEGSGLIYDDGTARPAMTWLMNYLRENPKR